MSSESIDLLWNASIEELKRLVQDEEKHGRPGDGAAKPASIDEAFRHFASLYVRYTLVLSDLDQCHAASVQPQKRIDIRATLEGVICRVINLRHLLVKRCPPNPDVASKGGAAQAPFPWERPDLNGVLRERPVAPSRLETATPAYFEEDRAEATRQRDSVVARLLREKSGSDDSRCEGEEAIESPPLADASSSDSGQCIGEAEETEETQPVYAPSKAVAEALPPEEAATKVQSIVRGRIGRQRTREFRRELDNLIGMGSSCADDRAETDTLESNLVDVRSQRRAEQQYCKESYENDLHRLKDVVRDEEGFRMQNELREERLQWITEHTISKNALPDSFEGFYAKDEPPEHDKENEDGAKGKGSKPKGSDKDAKDKGGKSKDKKENKEVERPVLAANPALMDPLRHCIRIYGERWQHRNVGPNRVKSQYHDVEMAKDLIVRDQVRCELTKGVDEAMLSNILKIKEMQEANAKKGKKKDAKGKKAKGKKKAGGGKKEKPLPGTKLPGMKEMSAEEMLATLVQNGLVSIPGEHAIGDFVGGFETGHPKLPNAGQERWIPDDPSAFQLRKAIMDYCILPLGSESIKSSISDEENVRSILLYGPEGCGKTLMVKTIASEIGALTINLSSSTIGGKFEGKEGATKLIHMAFTVAKEKAYAPVIIHLGDCHEFFLAKSKKGGSGPAVNAEMQRFQKDLLVYKNQALKKEDRVIVIGCTSMPEVGDSKLLRWKGPGGKPEKQGFFERSLYFPRPSHADRAMLWKHFIQRRIGGPDWQSKAARDIDYAALALLSDGWSAGEISVAVESSLSEDRLQRLASSPLTEHDFLSELGRETAPRDDERFLTFTRQITGLDAAWKSINAGDKAKKKK